MNSNTVATFEELLDKMRTLHNAKGADYGDGQQIYKNCRASERFNIPSWLGVAIRMTDKMSRLEAFAHQHELQVNDETIEDTFLDIANYALIGAILFAESKQSKTEHPAETVSQILNNYKQATINRNSKIAQNVLTNTVDDVTERYKDAPAQIVKELRVEANADSCRSINK